MEIKYSKKSRKKSKSVHTATKLTVYLVASFHHFSSSTKEREWTWECLDFSRFTRKNSKMRFPMFFFQSDTKKTKHQFLSAKKRGEGTSSTWMVEKWERKKQSFYFPIWTRRFAVLLFSLNILFHFSSFFLSKILQTRKSDKNGILGSFKIYLESQNPDLLMVKVCRVSI